MRDGFLGALVYSRTLLALGIVILAGGASTFVQSATFDVASVKINQSSFPGGMVDLRAGRFDATNETLRALLSTAFDVESFRVVGGPDWLDSDRFDVEARAGEAASREQTRLMLRSLLAERFRVRARLERRDAHVFALVRSRGAELGPQLRPAASEACVAEGLQPTGAAGKLPVCGRLSAGPGRMSGRSVSLELIATYLAPRLRRIVVNRTGLSGLFDIDLRWSLEDAQRAALGRLSPDGATPPPADPTYPGMATALNEQLGLRLEAAKGPVEVVVVESAARPSPN